MNLDTYLIQSGETEQEFGRRIGVTQSSVSKYRLGLRVPRPNVMRKIVAETGGQVTPNDFLSSRTPAVPEEATRGDLVEA